ncbi:MAG: glycosyltransferase family 4 protein, partial [Desulfobacteraceae bacterium]|nr:glycosyltransferase family 4 protein [Desulfobacteraceae bacterium]
MRIVIISDWFAEKMGYAENCLPKAIASLGHEVHLITSNVQPYFNSPTYEETYEPFIGPGVVACEVKELDGYTLHRLPYAQWRGRLRIKGLLRRLFAIQPQIVQTFDVLSLTTYEAALAKPFLGFKLFLESHLHASVFHPATRRGGIRERFNWLVYGATKGRLVSSLSEKCYPISIDAADVAVRFFGVEGRKVNICPLGVDTDLFRPASAEASREMRSQLRQQLGFSQSDIVCIYTGRFSEGKNPLCLAQAIGSLVAQGDPFRGLFVGSGPQKDAIRACPGCVVHPFVPVRELPPFYWAADIGVWPKQESTSQLDAAACGLPIILSNRVQARERIDGNGLTYEEGDVFDLTQTIRMLADPNLRRRMGDIGSRKMREHFSWDRIAGQRMQDYE